MRGCRARFIRQTIDLGGDEQKADAAANQFGGTQTANRLVFTIGKFGVTDIFDNNKYAHDPRGDFMNWSVIDTGTFDYAADAWGFSYGAPPNGTRATGRSAAASSTNRQCPTVPISIRASSNFSGSPKSSAATSYGASQAKSRSPDF